MAAALHDLFVNCEDCFCRQNKDGSYVKIAEPLTTEILEDHLKGYKTVGSYQLGKDNTVKYLCFDFDPEKLLDPKTTVIQLLNVLSEVTEEEEGERPRIWPQAVMLEASRYPDPSFHVWIFFEPAIEAKVAHWLGYRILELANLNPKEIEVFPKQTALSNDRPYGNFVKLPLGLHQKEQKWSRILDHETFMPLSSAMLQGFRGISFSEADTAKINSFKQKSNVQATFILPKSFKPLSDCEEEKAVKFLCKYWVKEYRNRLEMSFLGLCLKQGVSYESAKRIIEQVTQRTSDEERENRMVLVDYHYHNRLTVNLKASSGIREIIEELRQYGIK
jgi:hypothetical protein